MRNLIKLSVSLYLVLLSTASASSQVFLRLDEYGTTDAIRYYEGDKMEIKTNYYPDSWVQRRITQFIPESKTVVFDEDFYTIDEILAVRRVNALPKYMGSALLQFGIVWLTYGVILDITGTDDIPTSNYFIGGGSMLTGYILKRFASKKTYTLGDKYTLRMIDVRMTVEEK